MGLIEPKDMHFVSKSWGWESWICNNDRYCGKKLFIKQGQCVSFHFHPVKDEVLYVESGLIDFVSNIVMDGVEFGDPNNVSVQRLGPGFAYHVEPGQKHQMVAIEDTLLLEFSTTHRDEDSIRVTQQDVRHLPQYVKRFYDLRDRL